MVLFFCKLVSIYMNKFLKNFYDLYSDNDEEVYRAIIEKKDWILDEFYIPGDLNIERDENGIRHFPMLEDVVNDVISLKPYPFMLPNMGEDSSKYRYIVLYKKMKRELNPPLFWVKYDFRNIDEESYKALLANIFPRLPEEELEIEKDDNDDIKRLMKFMMIGEDHEMVLIVHEDNNKEGIIKAPIIREILYNRNAPHELVETLETIAESKGVVAKEIKNE